MIALIDDLPMVRLGDGSVAPFEQAWLLRALGDSARKAGYPQWWLAEHVASSVTDYLRKQQEAPVITVEALTRAVQQVLQVIGYAEIGRHFEAGRPLLKVSLVELAQAAGTGYELAFFALLRSRLADLVREKGTCFQLYGLERCVKLLRSKKAWSRDCAALRDEIVSFAREHTGSAAAQHEVTFSLA